MGSPAPSRVVRRLRVAVWPPGSRLILLVVVAFSIAGLVWAMNGPVDAQVPQSAPPARPTGLTGTFTHESVSLSWNDPGDPSITGYQILRRERGVHEVGEFQVHVDDTNSAATSYLDTAVEAEASYVYRVKARNSSGLSERSGFFRADIPAAPDPPAPGLPDPPTNLMAGAAGETQIDLSWIAPEDTNGSEIVGYRIEVSTDRGTSWNDLVADTGSAGTTYAHTGLVSGATRHYRASAISSAGTGAPSNIASATTDDLTPPGFIAGVVGADGDSLELYFNEPLDLDPGRTPRASSFRVTADGAPVAVGAVEVIAGREQSISLIGLSPLVRQGQTARVSYTDPTGGNDEAAIQDRAGNDAASLTDQSVTNGSALTGAGTRSAPAQDGVTEPDTGTAQIGAILAAKAQRTQAQRKVSAQLLDAIGSVELPGEREEEREQPDASAGWLPEEAEGSRPPRAPRGPGSAPRRPAATGELGEFKFVTVDIRADVTPEVLGRIRALGGTVINSVPKYRAIRAQIPLVAVQPLAALSAVQSIRPADEAVVHKDNTSEGFAAHALNLAFTRHSVSGAGIGIGVISDGVATVAEREASGDLPARVTVLPGQEGTGDEGTAMLEIVHDLAPDADLYFATGFSGQAQFAANIEALCEAGADVIVDDIGYYLEANFQDGIIAQGVNAATADGCYFFSAAGNDGNLSDGTSGVWEGDYVAGTSLTVEGSTVGVRHDFGSGREENLVERSFRGTVVLQWADPLGASANDYDLFLVDGEGNVLLSSTDTQDGTQDPIERISSGIFSYGDARLVIVKFSGADRYLRLQAFDSNLEIATAGSTWGHAAAENAIGVAQVDVRTAGGAGGIFDGTESVTTTSSDGPRRVFFEPDGTPITPGDFSSTGGKVLQKPDLAAAACVSTATPGFSTFCGTSAAAPHAAAIAALMLEAASGPTHVTLPDLRTAMTATTAVLDIEAVGVDNDSGAGIVMAPGAVAGVVVAVADRNGAPTVASAVAERTFAAGSEAVTVDLASTFTDPDSDTLTYSVVSSDPDRLAVTLSGTEITLTPGSPGRSVVSARVTDPGGLGAVDSFTVAVTAGNTDYDTDNDGLIEVTTPAQLDAMRYDLNGDGLVDGATWEPYYEAFSMGALEMGCPDECIGYELAANLDFDTDGSGIADSPDSYWNSGAGWEPIGGEDDPFTAVFDGDGHTLTNLYINRPTEDGVGLFGEVHYDGSGHIRDVGLVRADVTGGDAVGALIGRSIYMSVKDGYATGRVAGADKVGGLVGESSGNLVDTYAAVEVSGEDAVGGLVGHHILNTITTSYASGRVSGMHAVGGLVGATSDFLQLIQASYATGDVSGDGARLSTSDSGFIVCWFLGIEGAETSSGGGIGGVVGHSCGRVEASYATGKVSGDAAVGGLVGSGRFVWAPQSYWDIETSGIRVGVGEDDSDDNGTIDGSEVQRAYFAGLSTAELQAPTGYEGIYSTWNVDLGDRYSRDGEPDDPWDFGTTTQYPALSRDLTGDDRATWQEFGYQFRSALTLTATTTSGQAEVDLSWTAAQVTPWSPAPGVTYTVYRRDGGDIETVADALSGTTYTDDSSDVMTATRYTYRVAAVVAGGEVVRSAPVSVTAGEANQPPVATGILADQTLLLGADALEVDVAAAFRDPDGDTLTYTAASSQPSVAAVTASGSEVTVTPGSAGRATITVTATDAVGSNPTATQRFKVTVGNDYDSDDDGLIEIRTLAQLDALRHNLDGSYVPDDAAHELAFPTPVDFLGCGIEGCAGYELEADLDFDTDGSGAADTGDTYWNGGAGWEPIGTQVFLSFDTYDAIFQGNDHVIANLFISGGSHLGLFGGLGQSAIVSDLTLTNVDVTGDDAVGGLVGANQGDVIGAHSTGQVTGDSAVGGLAGQNRGFIARSSSSAAATYVRPADDEDTPFVFPGVGGLVGDNYRAGVSESYATGRVSGYPAGGLVGTNHGYVIYSYATGVVSGTEAGGLVGYNGLSPGRIYGSYATGSVSGNTVGGLVGSNAGEVTASYATGHVSGRGISIGGLAGEGGHVAVASYWDSTTSGIAGGRTTAQLQAPRGYSGIYATWNLDLDDDGTNEDAWDFGTSAEYPVLFLDFNGDGDETWQEFGHQLRAGPALTATGGEGLVVLNWAALDESPWTPPPGITYTLYRDATLVAENLNAPGYQDAGLTVGDYTYQLAAVVDGGEATRSALVTGTVSNVRPNSQPEFPSSEDGARSVDENTPASRNIGTAIAADDADNDNLTYSISGADAAAFAVVESSGQLQTSGALNRESRSSYSFTMSVHDGKDTNGHVDTTVDDTITVTVTVGDVDEPADISLAATGGVTVNNNALTVDESHDRTLATFTASDPEGMFGLTYQWSVVGTDRLDFAITAAAVLSFAAIPDYEHPADSGRNNVYDITVNALDSEGKTGELPVTVTVRDVNEVPEFPSTETGMRSVPENTPAGRTVGAPVAAVAGDNDTLTYSITSGANLFDINTATGQLLTKAALDREAAVSHTIRVGVSDGKDANNVAEDPPVVDNTVSVEIAVGDEDEAPEVMGPDAVAKAENSGTSVGNYTARDPENEAVSWTTLMGADARHFAFDNGALSLVSEPDFEARPDNTYEVTVRAQDAGGHIGGLRVTVTVLPVNERPTITGDAAPSVEEEGTLLVGTYRATDPENATIAWLPLAGGDADKFDFNSSNGRLVFKTAPDFEDPERRGDNEYDVTLSVSAGGHTPTFDVAVTVTNKEEPVTLTLPPTRPQEEADYTATLSDPDGVQSTTWTWERSTSRSGPWTAVSGAVNSIATSSVYTPVTGDVGDYLRATATYTDGHGPNKSGSAVSNDPVRAKPVTNNPPTFTETSPTRSIAENAGANAPVGGRVTATDPDSGDTVRYEFEPVPDLFTIDGSNGQIRVKNRGALDHETAPSHTVTVKALDSSNAFDTVQVTIEVTDVNEPPDALADAPNSFDEDTEIRIDVLANDSDPEDDRSELLLTVFNSGPNAPRNGAVTVNEPANAGENRTITYEPNADYNGADTFTYRVRDTGSRSLSSTASVSVQIDAVNDAPAFGESMPARSVSESAEAGARVGAPVTATDVDEGDTLTYSRYGADASSFEIDRQDGQITVGGGVTFDIATKDTYTVTVDASDGNGGSATVEVTITVTAGPVRPPIITGGGGGGGPSGPSPSLLDFEWNVTRDIDELDGGHDRPSGLWSDGVTLWLLENGDGALGAIYAYDLENGERVEGREFELDERNRAPRGIWSDRTTIWISDSGQNHLFAHDLATGERLPERDIELADRNRDARGIWSDGATMWVLDGGKNALFAYNLERGELLAEYALDSTNGDPHGVWSDGTTFWVSDHGAERLLAYRLPAPEEPAAEDAEPQYLERVIDEEFKDLSKASNNSPRGIWSDGDVMYVADESDDKVYTYNMPDAIDARLASLTLSGVELGEFLPVRTDYRGTGGDGVTETTVTAEALQRRTSVDIDPPDADEEAEGHQVALEGTSEITVTVMSADGSRELVYRVRLRDPEPTAASGPTSHCFRGDVAAGFSLVIYEGGSIEDLLVCALSRHIVALYVLDNGVYVPYIVGAPEFVNRSFQELYADGVLPLTPFVAGSDGPPSADTAVDRPPEDELATLRGSSCLHGEIATGFSLVLYQGGSLEELATCAQGHNITALYALDEGSYFPYILGAPDFVNRSFFELFTDGLPALTPLVAKSDSPLTASADSGNAAEN